MILKLRSKRKMSLIILCHRQKSADITVDPVNDARADNSVYIGKGVAAMVHKGRHKGSRSMSGGRVDHHSRGLIYNDNVAVLINDIKRDILRGYLAHFRLGELYCHSIPLGYLCIFLAGL